MLKQLEVNNIALIANETIDFENGLNVITGETGAGKSLLINSIGILLGNRMDKNLLRKNEEICKVKAIFSVDEFSKSIVENFCEKYDFKFEDEIIVSRTYNIKGKTDIKINGQIATLSMLKEICSIFVDAYFQNDNQKIFDKLNHLKIIDDYCKLEQMREFVDYLNLYERLKQINLEIKSYGGNEEERLMKIDMLLYQSKEIEDSNLSNEEYEDYKNKKQLFFNVGKIVSDTTIAFDCLENQTIMNLSKAKSSILHASNYDASLENLYQRIDSAIIELQDIKDNIENYNSNLDFSEQEQEKIEKRIDFYNKIFRKYSVSNVEELNEKLKEIKNELFRLQNANDLILKLENEKSFVKQKMFILAMKLHDVRQEYANVLEKNIANNLHQLGMKNSNIKFCFDKNLMENKEFTQNGLDDVELMFSANLGEELKPLMQIASGGEISRFMLALKSEIASSDNVGTIIFDEIDTGISGIAVEQVAKQMAKISKNHQVVAVTHSGQICAMADTNFLIFKKESDNQTNTYIKLLNQTEKIEEVARFMSGDNITEKSLESAKELISIQENFKRNL